MQLGGLPVETDVSPGVWISSARRRGEPGTVGRPRPGGLRGLRPRLPPRRPLRRGRRRRGRLGRGRRAQRHRRPPAHAVGRRSPAAGTSEAAEQPAAALGRRPRARATCRSRVAARLAAVLAPAHRARRTTAASAAGTASASTCPIPERLPRLLLRGGHDVVLVRGAVADAARNLAPEPHEQSANLWWPADRAWCVVTDIDLTSTYVGGSAACIAELLGTPGSRPCRPRPADSTARRRPTPVNPRPRTR